MNPLEEVHPWALGKLGHNVRLGGCNKSSPTK